MNFIYRISLISLLLLLLTNCVSKNKLDLGFEEGFPKNWTICGNQTDFTVALDSNTVKSGKYSIVMEFTGDIVDYRGFIYKLPVNHGERITLSGYIKTEDVIEGFAGLWLMTDSDPLWKPFEISFMEQYGVVGTNDWKKHEISLDIPKSNNGFVEIGALLSGKGKMWLDNLSILIDGKEIDKTVLSKSDIQKTKIASSETNIHSNIIIENLSNDNIYNLELAGRLWGFLKYHHPLIAKGNYDWDRELFKLLSIILESNSQEQRDLNIINWIKEYGEINQKSQIKDSSTNIFIKADLSWIKKLNVNDQLKELLINIYNNRNQGYNHYIEMRPYINNPIFKNEESYMGKNHLPDVGYRLLALFRYWNIINYFYPYKYLTDKKWDNILHEYISPFVTADTRLRYEQVTARLLCEICDSHAILQEGWEQMEALKGINQIPVYVKFIEEQLVVIYTNCSELKVGDIITQIEGKDINNIIDSLKHYYPASNILQKKNNIANDILRTHNNTLLLKYVSNGKIQQKNISTENRNYWLKNLQSANKNTVNYKIIDDNIGYINLSAINKDDIPIIKRKFANTDGIIIDLRIFPPDIFHLLAPFFVSETKEFARQTWANPNNPGEFILSPIYKIPKANEQYRGDLVVIINEDTGSNAEYSAMAFRAGDKVSIIGSNTAGYDGNISKIILPGGLITYFSGNGVYYPDGGETQRVGIIPDIKVEPSINSIKENRDELLERAVYIIKNNLNDIDK